MNNLIDTKIETKKFKLQNSKTNLQNIQKLFNKVNRTINNFVSLLCPLIIQLQIKITEKICPFKKKVLKS